MEGDTIRTAHWIGQDMSDPDFEDLDDAYAGRYRLSEYLHGWCAMFAMALRDVTGMPMFGVADSDELDSRGWPDPGEKGFPLVHAFCMHEPTMALVDCRGAVSDEKAFLEEFRDFLDAYVVFRYDDAQVEAIRRRLWYGPEKGAARRRYLEAVRYVRNHLDDYPS